MTNPMAEPLSENALGRVEPHEAEIGKAGGEVFRAQRVTRMPPSMGSTTGRLVA